MKIISSSRSGKGIKFLLRLRLAKLAYELTMRCQKHNLTSPNYNTGANNFLQVIYSLNSQFSYDVTRNYLNYYCYYYLEREHLSPHQIDDRSCNWYQLMLKITISIACILLRSGYYEFIRISTIEGQFNVIKGCQA